MKRELNLLSLFIFHVLVVVSCQEGNRNNLFHIELEQSYNYQVKLDSIMNSYHLDEDSVLSEKQINQLKNDRKLFFKNIKNKNILLCIEKIVLNSSKAHIREIKSNKRLNYLCFFVEGSMRDYKLHVFKIYTNGVSSLETIENESANIYSSILLYNEIPSNCQFYFKPKKPKSLLLYSNFSYDIYSCLILNSQQAISYFFDKRSNCCGSLNYNVTTTLNSLMVESLNISSN